MPWWQIIAILIAVGVVVGLALGLLSASPGFPTSWSAAGIGAAIGGVAVALVNRRNKANPTRQTRSSSG
jgi:membrane associated rhomboid family serine protease